MKLITYVISNGSSGSNIDRLARQFGKMRSLYSLNFGIMT